MTDTKLVITNKYSNNGNSSTPIIINGNCKISNYKPGEAKPEYFIFADIKNGKCDIQQKNGNKGAIDFSNEKYKLVQKIAAASNADGKTVLSLQDLNDMDKKKLGLDDTFVIKKDIPAGVASIYKKAGNKLTTYLRIDFETKNDTNSTTESTNYATLPFIRRELGYGNEYENKMKIPANTMIDTPTGSYIIDGKGKAFKFNANTKKWDSISSIEGMDVVSSKVIASIADNAGSNTDMTLNKADLKFKKEATKDVVDRFNYYNAKPAYWSNWCKVEGNTLECEIESVFKIANTKNTKCHIKVAFDTDVHKYMKEKEFSGGGANAEKIYKQISGPSLNKNTLKLVNGLSASELLEAIRVYNNHRVVTDVKTSSMGERYSGNGTFTSIGVDETPVYNENGMFKDLNDEWGIGKKDILPIIDKLMKEIPAYLKDTSTYKELQKVINSVDRKKDNDFDDATIQKIDLLFGKLLG